MRLIALVGGFALIVFAGGRTTTHDPRESGATAERRAHDADADADADERARPGQGQSAPMTPMATDLRTTATLHHDRGRDTTAWKSERHRRSFTKTGVGLVLDAGQP